MNSNQESDFTVCDINNLIEFTPFEVKTYLLKNGELIETNMLGR